MRARRFVLIATLVAAAATGHQPAWAAGVQEPAAATELPIDGIAAVVNGEVVTLAEVRRAALLLGRGDNGAGCGGIAEVLGAQPTADGAAPPAGAPAAMTADDTPATLQARALECLIDQRLVYREVRRFPQMDVTEQEFAAAWQQLVERFGGPDALAREARRFGSTLAGVRADLRRQLLVARYVDTRFRAMIEIDRDEARRFFEQELAPEMLAGGVQPPPIEAVLEEYVVPILREREVNRRIESWISDLRARARIERRLR